MTRVEVFAPAKINLTLHITGRQADGYHLIDSLVAFAPAGDRLVLTESGVHSITVEGPEARGVPADMDNLALKAANLIRGQQGISVTLEKNLPAASGIGGGSSDAAAAVRGCLALEDGDKAHLMAFGPQVLLETRFRPLLALGADIPMCLWPAPLRARGIGDKIGFVSLPPVPALLVNPRIEVSTGAVFAALGERDNPPMPEALPAFTDAAELIGWLGTQRNDLEAPARALAPEIGTVLSALAAADGCGLARMSGSGATCFGLFETAEAAQAAGTALLKDHPDWWLAGGVLGDMTEGAFPRVA